MTGFDGAAVCSPAVSRAFSNATSGPASAAAALTLPSAARVAAFALLLLLAYAFYEQVKFHLYRKTKDGKTLAGPRYPVPLVGGLLQMVMDPFAFWERQRNFSMPGMSFNSIMGIFTVFVTDPEVSRRVFSFNDPSSLLMGVHPSGKQILGESNLAFMHGPAHKAIRRSFLSLFTRKALNTYVENQDRVIREHIGTWLATASGTETEVRRIIRDMNAATSQEVFAGPYLALVSPEVRRKFTDSFLDMTEGFLAFPVCLPGTAVWRARRGRLYILSVLRTAAAQSKAAMKEGRAPRCLMDYWAQKCLEELADAASLAVPPPAHCSDGAMADTVMDFLFASQDASTASLVWTLTLMADHPDVLAKVRAEQAVLRPEAGAPISGELLQRMVYTRQVVRETLRFRPPAPMVPQIAQRDFAVTESYTVPKGTLIMPSITAAAMQGFKDAETFDPDRFSEARREDVTFGRNFLTFGIGPHACVGREYAINHLVAFLAIMSTSADWSRRHTPASDDWIYLPTVYPADSFITMCPRANQGSAVPRT